MKAKGKENKATRREMKLTRMKEEATRKEIRVMPMTVRGTRMKVRDKPKAMDVSPKKKRVEVPRTSGAWIG
jgi:hypothetical protein